MYVGAPWLRAPHFTSAYLGAKTVGWGPGPPLAVPTPQAAALAETLLRLQEGWWGPPASGDGAQRPRCRIWASLQSRDWPLTWLRQPRAAGPGGWLGKNHDAFALAAKGPEMLGKGTGTLGTGHMSVVTSLPCGCLIKTRPCRHFTLPGLRDRQAHRTEPHEGAVDTLIIIY